nr:glycosyltransferase [Chitinophagales bacterium]
NIFELEHDPNQTFEIIIINNGSTSSYDNFETYLNELPSLQRNLVNYINSAENLGVARGRNLGITLAKGYYLVFIDDDALFQEKQAPKIILEIFNQHNSPKHEHEQQQLSYNGNGILALREDRTPTHEYYIATKNKQLAKQPQFFTNFFVGSGHVVKKEVFEKVGLYPETIFYGMEEYDLAYKTINAGYAILYSAAITVLHQKSPNGREAETKLTQWNLENKTVIAYKYLPIIYTFSHFIAWSGYFLRQSNFNVVQWWQAFKNTLTKLKQTKRQPISKKALAYIKQVKGRLWY